MRESHWPEDQAKIDELIKQGKTILACKVYRDLKGCTLLEARDYVFGRLRNELASVFEKNARVLHWDPSGNRVEREPKPEPQASAQTRALARHDWWCAVTDQVEKIVDCGCCTLDWETISQIVRWWMSEHSVDEKVPEEDENGIAYAYNFYTWVRRYHPARRNREQE